MNANFEKSAYNLLENLKLKLEIPNEIPLQELQNSLRIYYISDVIRQPLKIPVLMVNFNKNVNNNNVFEIELKFPQGFDEIIEKDRNILNNFGVIQFENNEMIHRQLMIFSEEIKENKEKEMKIILVAP